MNPQNKIKNLETCFVLAIAAVIIFLFKSEVLFLYLAIALGVIGLFIPFLANIIRWVWYKLAEIMGAITSKIMLALIFFLLLTPIALLYRLFKKQKLQNNTYWINRDHLYSSKDLENPW